MEILIFPPEINWFSMSSSIDLENEISEMIDTINLTTKN